MIGLKHIINIAVPSFLWVLWSSCKTCLQRQGWEKIILSSIELFFPGNLVAYKYVEGCCNDCDADRPPPHALLRFLVEEGSPCSHVSMKISCYVIVWGVFCVGSGKKPILAFCSTSVFNSRLSLSPRQLFLYLGLRSFNFWRWHGMPFPTYPMPGKTTGVYYPLINWGKSIEIRSRIDPPMYLLHSILMPWDTSPFFRDAVLKCCNGLISWTRTRSPDVEVKKRSMATSSIYQFHFLKKKFSNLRILTVVLKDVPFLPIVQSSSVPENFKWLPLIWNTETIQSIHCLCLLW